MVLHESVVKESGFDAEAGPMFQKRQCGRVKNAWRRDSIGKLLLLLLLQGCCSRGGGAEAAVEQEGGGAGSGEEGMERSAGRQRRRRSGAKGRRH